MRPCLKVYQDNKYTLLIILLLSPIMSWGQLKCQLDDNTDSVLINYRSLCEFLDVNIVITNKSITYYDSDFGIKRSLLYQTFDKDTIFLLHYCINIVLEKDPIYDTTELIIPECMPSIGITIFNGASKCEKWYEHYYDALFPFAYAEMYGVIIPIISKYRKPYKP